MKMRNDAKKILLYLAVGCAIAAVLALCGCGSFKGFQVSGCSGSKCATATVQPVGGGGSHASGPAATASAAPTPTVPLSSPTYDPEAAVVTCLGPDPSRGDLAALAVYDSTAQQQLIVCLVIPAGQQSLFMQQVAQAASRALDAGRFDDHHGRVYFTDQVLPPVAARCHSGQSS